MFKFRSNSGQKCSPEPEPEQKCCSGTGTGTGTGIPVDLWQEHCKFLKEKFDIVVSKVNEKIPRIFWNPKLHKNPYKARFIAGARNSSTKQ